MRTIFGVTDDINGTPLKESWATNVDIPNPVTVEGDSLRASPEKMRTNVPYWVVFEGVWVMAVKRDSGDVEFFT